MIRRSILLISVSWPIIGPANHMKNIYSTTVFTMCALCSVFLLVGCFTERTIAQEVSAVPTSIPQNVSILFEPDKKDFNLVEEFEVKVNIETYGKNINAIQGKIYLSPNLELIGIKTGDSIITSWVERPKAEMPIIFTGVIIGGFEGLIEVFHYPKKLPGNILTLVVKAKSMGPAYIEMREPRVLLNDGQGTEVEALAPRFSFQILSSVNSTVIEYADTLPVIVSAEIMRDPLLYDGKYALIFAGEDKGSGISYFEVQEGKGEWVKTESPYILADQSLRSEINLKAVNFAGKETIQKVALPGTEKRDRNKYILVVGIFILAMLVERYFRKRRERKTIHN